MKYEKTLSLTALCVTLAIGRAQAQGGTWTPTGSLGTGRSGHTETLLSGGEVLVAGGNDISGTLTSAELYDPATGMWTATGNLGTARVSYTATPLTTGKVLVVGGVKSSNGSYPYTYLNSSELYDPATGTWTATGDLGTARTRHTATLLPNGKVLVTGGADSVDGGYSESILSSSELYDPATGTWTGTSDLGTERDQHTATLLPNGKVLVFGGYNNSSVSLGSSELYDPGTGTWAATGSLGTPRFAHTATLLPGGKVLAAGGYINTGGVILSSSELYDPATGTWTATGNLGTARWYHTATLLPSGEVVVAGGDDDGPVASTELYDPGTGTWTATGSLSTAREQHTATLLANGTVLVTGGHNGRGTFFASAELYEPAQPCSTIVTSVSGPSAPISLGGTASLTADFIDTRTTDMSACSIAWGDSTSSAGTVSEANGSGTCTGYHQYTATGSYAATVTITDSCNAISTGTFQPVVIYVSCPSSITSNFNGTTISAGNVIWFNSVMKVSGLASGPTTIYLDNATIQFSAGGNNYNLSVLPATITFSPTATAATTTFDGTRWVTVVPSGIGGNTFLTGLSFPVPVDLPGGIKPVTWSGSFTTDTPGVSVNWQWAAAVYKCFSTSYSALGVKPVDSNSASNYKNSDHAGTPENFESCLISGARGGGGSNFTGGYSGTASKEPCPTQ